MKEYNFSEIESKWERYWEKNKTFKTNTWDFSKPKFYALDMFPYPSGSGLHIGHPEGYIATDVMCRMKRMQGFNVLHPMGFDSFGLSAEQYAIDTGNYPDEFTRKNIETFTEQLRQIGFSYDWDRVISTCDPSYYKWTQWIFLQLFKDGLAKYKGMPVNWCEELGTVLANDEIIDGKSERGGFPVVRKLLNQWVIDTPAYAEKLLTGLDGLDWPESTKEMQRNWIGKSEGAQVKFQIVGGGEFSIFTTCIETIYGITFMVLAPESNIVEGLKDRIKNWQEVKKYIDETAKKSEFERSQLNKGKTGCLLEGVYAINPVNGREIPLYVADFVIASYGTGAVMAVPSHDQRDYEFAEKHNIPMIEVISGGDTSKQAFEKGEYLGKGCKLVNSEEFTGLTVEQAKKAILDKLIEKGVAEKKINFRLRDWIFARQRYWGEPVPVIHMEDGTIRPLEDKELPLVLPQLKDYRGKNGKAPLENAEDWVNVEIDGKKGKRETSTMPGSAGSSWYFLRYIDPQNNEEFANPELLKHWMPVDLYVGGPEHAVGHLLYARMWNNYLFDKGLVFTKEPFKKLVHQGMILGSNGIKMGKRFPEFVVDPRDIVKRYGADALRLYEMFMGPIEASKPWTEDGISGAKRFLDRVWRVFAEEGRVVDVENDNLKKIYSETVKKVSEDYTSLGYNTAISQMMIFINAVYKEEVFPKKYAEGFLRLFNPICPFITEELWEMLGNKECIAYEKWPTYNENDLIQSTVEIAIQVNSKIVARMDIDTKLNEKDILEEVKKNEKVALALEGKSVVKEIVIPNRLINIICK